MWKKCVFPHLTFYPRLTYYIPCCWSMCCVYMLEHIEMEQCQAKFTPIICLCIGIASLFELLTPVMHWNVTHCFVSRQWKSKKLRHPIDQSFLLKCYSESGSGLEPASASECYLSMCMSLSHGFKVSVWVMVWVMVIVKKYQYFANFINY